MFKIRFTLLSLVIISFLVLGCGETNTPIDNNTNPDETTAVYEDGLNLMGFADSHSFNYLKVDTVTSLDSVYSYKVNSSFITYSYTGNNDNWIVKRDNIPYNNIKVSEFSILLNGYWKNNNDTAVINYFSVPPMIMPRKITKNISWSGYFPPHQSDSTFLFYNAYYGFHFDKKFMGIERITIPAGEFDAYRFDVDLYDSEFTESPVIQIKEYYVPFLGLVKHQLTGGPLKQSLSLIDTTSIIDITE